VSERAANRPLGLDAAATVALATYSAVAALGFARVFGDWEFARELLAIVIVGHGTSFLLRRVQLSGWLTVSLLVVVLGWLIASLHYPDTFATLFPSTETWTIASDDISLARQQFRDAVAPVAYVGGFAVLASIGTGFAVVLGDTFAFRAGARGEALVPAGVLFVFVAAVGTGQDRVVLTVLLVAAGLLATIMLRLLFENPPRTTLGRARPRLALVMPAAIMTASLVAIVAWALGPRLPGANAEPLYKTRGRGGGVTEVVSPLVDIRGRLVKRSATVLFDVRAAAPAYWRVSSLPEFDGQTWRLPDRALEDVEGTLAAAPVGAVENRQRVTIGSLDGSLVPAAAEPVAASGPLLRWSPDTSTLVKIEEPLAPGDLYDIVSAMPRFDPEQLATATSDTPPDPIYLELPDGFPSGVADLAADVTAGAGSTYQAARQLQAWFRAEFDYSLEVPQGHGNSAIEAFVRQRIGYCEQFAGTYAAMMRSIGIPARVAVGFTPGLVQPDGSYQVLGRNAHAWPEVWFDEFGWVGFEPTPGRGAPGAERHTGVAADQDETVGGGDNVDGEGNGDGDGVPAPAAPVEPRAPTDPDARNPNAAESPGGPQPAADGAGGGGLTWRTVWYGFLVLLALAWLPLIVRKWRRRHHRGSAEEYVADLWRRTVRAVEIVGVRCPPSATPVEVADSAAPRLAVASRPLHELASVVTATAYSPPGQFEPGRVRRSGSSTLTDAARWCRQIEEIARETMSPSERLRHHFTEWR
jgi:transglutaminase-like putative cysteine protease